MNPNAEPTLSQLSQRGLTLAEMIYRTEGCSVYKAIDNGQHVALKFLLFSVTGNSTESLQREVENQFACQKHPGIVQIINYFYYYLNAWTWVAAIEMELLQSDVYKDIENRRKNDYPYDERALLSFISTCVEALAFAQDLNISHRDVKPQNIFLLQGGGWKLGDFGSSKQVAVEARQQSLAGTPFYLSPALRAGIAEGQNVVVHNPYKSDVYSLGLTVLHMARLEPVNIFGESKSAVQTAIESLQQSNYFKQLLWWMLAFEERDRPDFIQIRAYIQSLSRPAPQVPRTQCEHLDEGPASFLSMPCGHRMCDDCAKKQLILHCIILQIRCEICGSTMMYQNLIPAPVEAENQERTGSLSEGDEHKFLTNSERIRVQSGVDKIPSCPTCTQGKKCSYCIMQEATDSREAALKIIKTLNSMTQLQAS